MEETETTNIDNNNDNDDDDDDYNNNNDDGQDDDNDDNNNNNNDDDSNSNGNNNSNALLSICMGIFLQEILFIILESISSRNTYPHPFIFLLVPKLELWGWGDQCIDEIFAYKTKQLPYR